MMELVSLESGCSDEDVGWNEDNRKALERLWVSLSLEINYFIWKKALEVLEIQG